MSDAPVVFHEDWFSEASCEAVAKLARMALPTQGDFIEIGSWEGRSTIAIANAIAPRRLIALDTWEGSIGEISRRIAQERNVYAQFVHNVGIATKGNVEWYRLDWRDYFKGYLGPVAFCFIDACHSFEEVDAQLTAILPTLRPGAILCGDDAHHPPIQEALTKHLDARRVMLEATLWWWRYDTRG